MSNIDPNSLVFALPGTSDTDEEIIMCQMPIAMIMNWMFVVSPHSTEYRRVQKHYIALSVANGINQDDSEAILDYSNDIGMRGEIQVIMMNVIIDLHKLLGTKDFLELYKLEIDEEDDGYLSGKGWVGKHKDGTTLRAKIINGIPEYESDQSEQND